MSNNLLESLSGLITPDVIGRAAAALGDSEPAVTKGMGAVFPVLLGSIANRADDPGFASTLFNLVRDPANDGSLLGNVSGLLAPGATSSPMMALGGKLITSLFGNNVNTLGNSLANYAGVRPASANSMLNFAAPLVLSLLGKAVRSGNLNLSSLVSLLTGQRSAYAAAIPGPLSRLESYFASPVREPARETYAAPPPPEKKSSIGRWLIPLIAALIALWLLSRCMGPREEATVETVPAPAPAAEPAPLPAPVEPAPMAEPATAETPLANLYFEVDKFDVPVAREGSLDAVIEYLKANPTAVASVSGYHDPTGDKAYNEDLAKRRAQAVKDVMMAGGVAESQIDLVKPVESTGSGDLAEARRVEVAIRR